MNEQTFADRLRTAREAAGLSRYELARRAGIPRESVSQAESGAHVPVWETIQLLALVLGVPVNHFCDPNLRPPEVGPPGRPGRPRKPRPVDPTPKRPRGRPRKTPLPGATS